MSKTLDAPCKFGKFSAGTGAVSMSVSIPDEAIKVSNADYFLRGSQCKLVLRKDPNAGDDTPGQTTMNEPEVEVEFVADIPSYRRTPKHTSFTISMASEEVGDITADLMELRESQGRIVIERMGAISRKSKSSENSGDGEGDE
jgi:hypothetical protein